MKVPWRGKTGGFDTERQILSAQTENVIFLKVAFFFVETYNEIVDNLHKES